MAQDWCSRDEILKILREEEKEIFSRYLDDCVFGRNLRLMWQLYPLMYALNRMNREEAQKIKCWVEKEGDFAELGAIQRNFPRGRFIFVIRDPRAAVASLARRVTKRKTGQDRMALGELVNYCYHGRSSMQKILRFSSRHPDISLTLKYEDFVSAPDEALEKTFEFISVSRLEKAELRKLQTQLYYTTSNDPGEFEENKGISSKSSQRWKTLLTESEANLVARLTGVTARKLGYNVQTSQRGSEFLRVLVEVGSLRWKIKSFLRFCHVTAYELCV